MSAYRPKLLELVDRGTQGFDKRDQALTVEPERRAANRNGPDDAVGLAALFDPHRDRRQAELGLLIIEGKAQFTRLADFLPQVGDGANGVGPQ